MKRSRSLFAAIIGWLLLTVLALAARAETFYAVEGKIATGGEAHKAAEAGKKVIKIQATYVQVNEKSGNLKKSSDASLKDIKGISE